MGLVGLMNTLKLEGEKHGVKVNTVSPIAVTRLTEGLVPEEMRGRLRPEAVAPLVIYLCSEQCAESGLILNAGMGHFSRVAIVEGPGVTIGDGTTEVTPEEIHRNWGAIQAVEDAREYKDAMAALAGMLSGPPKPRVGEEPEAATGAGDGVAAAFARMSESFNAAAAAGVDVEFQFIISGPGGGEWSAVVRDGACQIERGTHAKPTTTLKMAGEDFLAMAEGRLSPMKAYTSGKLRIEGDLMKSQLVPKLWRFGA
jgi:putative sterol carrier protein